ncbi:MAG: polysaccharide deacetylase family protein [Oscillospiraceae bacterium]|nr:polysaccharide deacetylase family protein [Oscillospiraceae bacterium]
MKKAVCGAIIFAMIILTFVINTSISFAAAFSVGDTVIVNGRPSTTATGGTYGTQLTNYVGQVTKIATSGTRIYHIDSKGWFSESELRKYASGTDLPADYSKYDNKTIGWWNVESNLSYAKARLDLIGKYGGIGIDLNEPSKVIYLTFDEGYENGYTSKILDVLKANNVHATFFITGSYLDQDGALVKRMIDEGHTVGNHTVNHPSLPSVSKEQFIKEIKDVENDFKSKFGITMKYLRPPYGEYSERTMAMTNDLGYKTVFWTFTYLDYDVNDQKGTDYAYNKVMSSLRNGSILLLHAVSKDNANALDKILKDAKAMGYRFANLDDIK